MNKNKINIARLGSYSVKLLLILVVVMISGCVSQKKKGDVSKLSKAYHNTTAKYNGYFNANELVNESIVTLQESYDDNFYQILPIYKEVAAQKPETVSEDLNKAIEKVTIVASVHDPSHWVDDCYVLLGKAEFLKQEYESSQEALEYFIEEFDPSKTRRKASKKKKSSKGKKSTAKRSTKKKKSSSSAKKKKKKKKKKGPSRSTKRKKVKPDPNKPKTTQPETKIEQTKVKKADPEVIKASNTVEIDKGNSGILKHQSAYPEGLLWLAKTCVKRDKFSLADYYLKKITEQSNVKKEILEEIPVVKAFSSLEKKDYTEAITNLSEAIKVTKDKFFKARLYFIRAQLYQIQGNNSAAASDFQEVIDLKPAFIMSFNAELSMLRNSMQGSRDVARIEKRLEAMLKEDKYNNFKDQIYFTLGEIQYDQGEVLASVPNFQKSVKHHTNNKSQLVEAYYKLATIFYDEEDYVMSKNYYDSTATNMPENDERSFLVKQYSLNLEDIAKNINIITLQDSLLKISELSIEEKELLASTLKKDELKQKVADAKSGSAMKRNTPVNMVNSIDDTQRRTTWWAYDENKKIKGKSAFERKWGIRTLEDDWRRSAKSSGITEIQSIKSIEKMTLSEEEINEILKDVPSNPTQVGIAKRKIEDALFELGVLFREKIENYNKSIESHQSLEKRFISSKHEPDALYYLYLNHLDINNPTKAQYYLNQLKSKYPEAKYTLALTDPTYVEKFINEEKIQETFYENTYRLFEERKYQQVIDRSIEATQKFANDNVFQSKYALITAMSNGKLNGEDAYIESLKSVVSKFPNTPEQARANEILRFLKGDAQAFDIGKNENKENFKNEDEKTHYMIIVLYSDKDADLNAAKISINNFNRKYHKIDKIRTSSNMLNVESGHQLILLRKWTSKDEAMKYYDEVNRNIKEFLEIDIQADIFAITQRNYREIMKQRSVVDYKNYFEENYK